MFEENTKSLVSMEDSQLQKVEEAKPDKDAQEFQDKTESLLQWKPMEVKKLNDTVDADADQFSKKT